MNNLIDGGGMIFAAIGVFGFLAALAWFGLNRAVHFVRVEIEKLRSEMKTKRIYETDRYLDRNRVSLDEIIEAKKAGRISSFNEFVSIDNLSRSQIIGQKLETVLTGETTQPFNHSQVLQIGVSVSDAMAGASNMSKSGIEFAAKQPKRPPLPLLMGFYEITNHDVATDDKVQETDVVITDASEYWRLPASYYIGKPICQFYRVARKIPDNFQERGGKLVEIPPVVEPPQVKFVECDFNGEPKSRKPPPPSTKSPFGAYDPPNQSAEFEKGNRQPITEILSEIYDEEEK